MSMSTHIIGFIPPDEKWRKVKAVWDACEEAGVDVPEVVKSFFDYEYPGLQGVKINLRGVAERYSDDMESGYELKVEDIPEHVKVLRFYNSW